MGTVPRSPGWLVFWIVISAYILIMIFTRIGYCSAGWIVVGIGIRIIIRLCFAGWPKLHQDCKLRKSILFGGLAQIGTVGSDVVVRVEFR